MLGLRDQMLSADIGVQRAQTVRPASTALLTIDSADRFATAAQSRDPPVRLASPYDFSITKNESIMNGFFTRLAVTEVVLPWPFPNINARSNVIQLEYQTGGVGPINTVNITLEPGFYPPHILAAQFEAAVQVYVPGFQMAYSPQTTPTTPSYAPLCFQYNPGADNVAFLPMVANSAAYPYSDQTTQLYDVLGFTIDQTGTLSVGTKLGQPTLCQSVRYVDITSPQLVYNQSLKDSSSQRTLRDSLCRVYLADANNAGANTVPCENEAFTPPGCAPTVIYRNFSTAKQIQWAPNQPVAGFLQFQLYDDNGETLAGVGGLTGLDWSMTLLVSEN